MKPKSSWEKSLWVFLSFVMFAELAVLNSLTGILLMEEANPSEWKLLGALLFMAFSSALMLLKCVSNAFPLRNEEKNNVRE